MKVKTTYTGCDYITAGKEYELRKHHSSTGWIVSDDSKDILILLPKACAHLKGEGTWESIE